MFFFQVFQWFLSKRVLMPVCALLKLNADRLFEEAQAMQ